MAICRPCNGKGVIASLDRFGVSPVCAKCRGTGILKLAVKDLLPQDHACFFYDDPKSQLQTAVDFILEGLKQSECCFYVVDEHRVEEAKEAFTKSGVNVKKQIDNRALNILTKKETYLVNGYFDASEMLCFIKDAVKAATSAGFLAFRGAGEMTWALGGEPGCAQVISYEFLLDEYFENVKPDMATLCQYNLRRFPPGMITNVLHAHKVAVLPDGKVVANPYHQEGNFRSRPRDAAELDNMMKRLRKEVIEN